MLNTEYIYSKEKRQNRLLSFNWGYSLPIALAFLLSRASLVDKLTPFGIAFISACLFADKFNIYVLISSIIGVFSHQGLAGMGYIVAIIAISISYNLINRLREFSLITSAIITSAIFALVMSLYSMIFKTLLLYDLLIIGFESLIVFTLTYIFSYNINPKVERFGTNERIISLFITLALVLSGINELNIYGISIKNLISIVIIIYTGHKKELLLEVPLE